MAEGMSQGLPVFGSSFGSLPEVIGPAGVKAKSKQELLEAVKNWDIQLSPKEIREYAIENFSIENYTKSYLKIYERVINGESLSDKNPIRDSKKDPEDLYRF